MPLLNSHRRWVAWMAAVAILLGALAPTVSRWLAASQAGRSGTAGLAARSLLEVCASRADTPSLRVLKRVPADVPGKMALDHCPLCSLHADKLGMPPTTLPLAVLSLHRAELPKLFLNAPRPLHVWPAALARAPPATQA